MGDVSLYRGSGVALWRWGNWMREVGAHLGSKSAISNSEVGDPDPWGCGTKVAGALTVLWAGADDLFHAHCTPVHVIIIALGRQERGEGEGRPGGGERSCHSDPCVNRRSEMALPLARAHG